MRLSAETLGQVPASVARPAYDRAAVKAGVVHLGIGAFHRAHQAAVFEAALASGDLRWGVVGVSLRSASVRDQMNPQDGLYTLLVREGAVQTPQIIGAVQRVLVAPPQSRIGPLSVAERAALVAGSPLQGRYDKPIDRESAYEVLMARKALGPTEEARQADEEPSFTDKAGAFLGTTAGKALKSAMQQAANQMGRQLVRGLLGSLLGGSKRK